MRVQTPQAVRFDSILAAHRAWTGSEPTEDAEGARAAGLRVAEVGGDEMLKKLTAPDDFGWAERTITAAMTTRTGMGFDVHAFGAGARSEERRVGKECVSTCRYRWTPYH